MTTAIKPIVNNEQFRSELRTACLPFVTYLNELISSMEWIAQHPEHRRLSPEIPLYDLMMGEFEGEGCGQTKIQSLCGPGNEHSFTYAVYRLATCGETTIRSLLTPNEHPILTAIQAQKEGMADEIGMDGENFVLYDPETNRYSSLPGFGSESKPVKEAIPSVLAKPLLALYQKYRWHEEYDPALFHETCFKLENLESGVSRLIERQVLGYKNYFEKEDREKELGYSILENPQSVRDIDVESLRAGLTEFTQRFRKFQSDFLGMGHGAILEGEKPKVTSHPSSNQSAIQP